MTAKTDLYRERAEDAEAQARASRDPGSQAAFRQLATGYRHLISYVESYTSAKLYLVKEA